MSGDVFFMTGEDPARGGVFALGNFDGAHRGHRVVLETAQAQARALGVPACVLTFEPHPRAFFMPHQPPFRLTPPAAKERLLKQGGIDAVAVASFTGTFARLTAQQFIDDILIKRLKARAVVAGHDFTFGFQRGGNGAFLSGALRPRGIGVTLIDPVRDGEGGVYSSTRIRDFLRNGHAHQASALLGRDWAIEGLVVRGAQRGRTIGVPTANIALDGYLRPRFGVYAVRANKIGGERIYAGVANIGTRPTVDGATENLEAHLFDFAEDIYDQEWTFALTRFIRPERKFSGIAELKAQIDADIASAKQV